MQALVDTVDVPSPQPLEVTLSPTHSWATLYNSSSNGRTAATATSSGSSSDSESDNSDGDGDGDSEPIPEEELRVFAELGWDPGLARRAYVSGFWGCGGA